MLTIQCNRHFWLLVSVLILSGENVWTSVPKSRLIKPQKTIMCAVLQGRGIMNRATVFTPTDEDDVIDEGAAGTLKKFKADKLSLRWRESKITCKSQKNRSYCIEPHSSSVSQNFCRTQNSVKLCLIIFSLLRNQSCTCRLVLSTPSILFF